MYEKKLDFQIYSLDVASGEQFSEWFLKMSPRGDIPVLQDALIIVPEATKIFQYIDHLYYTTGNITSLSRIFLTKLKNYLIHRTLSEKWWTM